MTDRIKRALLLAAAALMILGLSGTTAVAQPVNGDAGVLVDKVPATTTLVLEGGRRLRLTTDTVIVKDGEKISFAGIPTAKEALPGIIMIHWTAKADGSARDVMVRHLLN